MTDLQTADTNATDVNWLTTSAILLPVVVLMVILAGALFSTGSVLAEESTENTRMSADMNDSYFADASVNENVLLAQGLLEPRSDSDTNNDDSDADMEEETAEDADSDTDSTESQAGDVAGEQECGQPYLSDDLRIDFNNDREEVLKLQSFLKTFADYDYVELSGTFDESTLTAVEAFQTRHAEDILEPWGYQADEATGYVYITTKQKINEIYCEEQFLLSNAEQTEIRNYRQKLNQWRAQGASFETPNYLANYWADDAGNVAGENDSGAEMDAGSDDEMNESDTDSGVTVTEEPAESDEEATSSATSGTTTTEEDDDGGFFDWLFGGSDDETSTTTDEATSTDESTDNEDVSDEEDADTEDDSTATDTDSQDETATDTAAATGTESGTSSFDQLAAGIFTGVNGIFDFIFSPTFLLIVLVILILLLIATLIDTSPEDITAKTDKTDESADSDSTADSDESDPADSEESAEDDAASDKRTDDAPTAPDTTDHASNSSEAQDESDSNAEDDSGDSSADDTESKKSSENKN